MRTCSTLLLLTGLSLGAVAAPSLSELTELFLPAELASLKLSPDGQYVGLIGRRGDKFAIGVHDLRTGTLDLSKTDNAVRPVDFWWKGPRRLLVQTSNYKLNSLGYDAFDVDGKNPEDAWRLTGQPGRLLDAQVADPRHVLMVYRREINQVDLDTGHAKTLDHVPAGHPIVDVQGRARACSSSDFQDGTADLWWNSSAGGEWQTLHFASGERRFIPRGVDAGGRYLWGWAWGGQSPVAVARFDTQNRRSETFDFVPGLGPTHLLFHGSTRQPIAVAYAQGPTVHLFALAEKYKEGIARLQKNFEGFFPMILDVLPDDKTWLVWIGNSRLPGAYFQFNRLTGEAVLIGLSHGAAITEERLAPSEYFTFPRRNGEALSARLWRPAGPAPLPLIVFCPSSLPAAPALDVYQDEVQALVAQGFAVLQVNVRGTLGFGQPVDITKDADWATIVQEDLEDGVEELVRQKIADPKSVNLLGGGFGGVLALEIATKSNRFTALAALNAPAKVDRYDLMRFSDEKGAFDLSGKLGGWMATARLARDLSPVLQVAELKIPALFIHNEDSIKGRPDEDGRAIRSALAKVKVPTRTGLGFSWSDRPKAPSLLARENASISMQIAAFFRSPSSK